MTKILEKVGYTRMDQMTKSDIRIIEDFYGDDNWDGATVALAYLDQLKEDDDAHPFSVDRYEHSLQSATLAHRDGADEEMVVAALLHDIGDMIAPYDHAAASAAILRPFVSDETHWVVHKHGLFQGYYYFHLKGGDRNERDHYKGHPNYQACIDFCAKWDQPAFEPDFDTMPIKAFEPMVRRVFATPRWGMLY